MQFILYLFRAMSDDEFVPKKKKDSPKKAAKKEPAVKKEPVAKKAPAKKNNGTNDDVIGIDDSPVAKLPPKKAPPKKKAPVEIDDNDDVPVSKPERKPRAAASKPKRSLSSSDSDDVFKSPSTSRMFIF